MPTAPTKFGKELLIPFKVMLPSGAEMRAQSDPVLV